MHGWAHGQAYGRASAAETGVVQMEGKIKEK